MCDECNVIPCKNGCPNKSDNLSVECDVCGEEIYNGGDYFSPHNENVYLCSEKCVIDHSGYVMLVLGEDDE